MTPFLVVFTSLQITTLAASPRDTPRKRVCRCLRLKCEEFRRLQPQRYSVHDPPSCGAALTLTIPVICMLGLFRQRLGVTNSKCKSSQFLLGWPFRLGVGGWVGVGLRGHHPVKQVSVTEATMTIQPMRGLQESWAERHYSLFYWKLVTGSQESRGQFFEAKQKIHTETWNLRSIFWDIESSPSQQWAAEMLRVYSW